MHPNNCPKCGFPALIMPHKDYTLRENGWMIIECQDCGYMHSFKEITGDCTGKQFMKELEEKGVTHIIGLFDG